ncbi:MAG: tRNA lysidine(34) synthetase TilS [Bacteroidota bacterium]
MLERFKEFIGSERLFQPEQKIILAVSGGVDSAVLAELFHRAEFRFAIAHCNFMLRGKESDDDEAFCEQLARRYKVLFACERFDTARYVAENKVSLQAAARKLRYDWFSGLLEEQQFDYIATAHQKNDVLETMLINFTRGTGIAGLHGILPRQGRLIRPLLFATRQEIESFAAMQQIAHRIDSSNSSEKYVRNKIRMRVIPVLQEINPSIEQTAIQTSKNLYSAELILKNHLALERKRCISQKGRKVLINIKKLRQLDPVRAYLFEFLREYGFNAKLTEQVADALSETPGKKFLSESHMLVKDRENLILTPMRADDDYPEVEIKKTEKRILKPVKLSFSKETVSRRFVIPPGSEVACLDLERLRFPLKLRRWLFGDRFVPLGMSERKKVSDFLIDNKVSVSDKEGVWVLLSGHDICWVVGHRIDDRYKITPKTRKVFKVVLKS